MIRLVRAHPIAWSIAAVAIVALALRLAFLLRAPVLATGDSESYLGPAWDLAWGQEFDLSLKRTPAYPAFVAFVIRLAGEDLRSLVFVQHLLGVGTALLALALGRLCFGNGVGLVAGLLTAMDGALLLPEHSVMTEALFIPVLVAAVAAIAVGMERAQLRWLFVGGLLVALATLTRPIAQIVLPVAIVCLVLRLGISRAGLGAVAVIVLGYAALTVPWMLRSVAEQESAAIGSLGQTLVGRIARHDRGGFDCLGANAGDGDADPAKREVRKAVQQAVDRGSSGKAVHTRLRKELGLGGAAVDRMMRDVALECIWDHRGYYVAGTIQRFVRLSIGGVERLGPYRNASDVARREWEDEETRHLLPPATPAEERAAPTAARLVQLFQPAMVPGLFPAIAVLGIILLAIRRRFTSVLFVGLVSVALLFVSAALVGNVPRYRFPTDPLVIALAVGFANTAIVSLWRRVSPSGSGAR